VASQLREDRAQYTWQNRSLGKVILGLQCAIASAVLLAIAVYHFIPDSQKSWCGYIVSSN